MTNYCITVKFHFDLLAPIYEILIPPVFPQEMLTLLGDLKGKKILEVGGGTGRLAQYLLKYSDEVWIMDPSLPMLYKAKKANRELKLIHGYAEKQPFPDEFFDLIIAVDSLHHWDHHEKGIQEVYRVLKSRGIFFIGEIHPKDKAGHFIVQMEKTLLMRSRFFMPSELLKILKENNFSIVDIGWLKKPTYFVKAVK